MPQIPSTINGVNVEFGPNVTNSVSASMIDGLKSCISGSPAANVTVTKIYISSVTDQHVMPSRHMQHKAVDISRINGVKIVEGYPSNATVKAAVEAIQSKFESFSGRRENFGPFLKKKLGQPWSVSGHNDHIHLSVN